MGEEGKAAPDDNPVAAPGVCEVGVCAAGCSVAWAAGAALGAGMLFGATTVLSVFFADTCGLVTLVVPLRFAPAAFDAAATIAGQIGAALETVREWKVLNQR